MSDPRIDLVHAALREKPAAWLIAIAGIPGAGKTTLAQRLAAETPGSAVLPMDGYHLPRTQLDAEGLRRRGAPHTFDPRALRTDLAALRLQRTGRFPAFDHAVKDPEPGAIEITSATSLVIVEGLYLLLRAWELASLFDLTLFLDCDLDLAMDRVAARHLACGLAETPAAARERVESNDRPNALAILADGCRERADFVLG